MATGMSNGRAHVRRSTRARASAEEQEQEQERDDENLAARRRTLHALLGSGFGLEEVMERCGFKSRSQARHALAQARKAVAEDTAEEQRLDLLAGYAPIRQVMHNKALNGDVRAVEALVKLDERMSRLFGLDLGELDASLSAHYTKRIVLEGSPAQHTTSPTEASGE